MHGNTAMNKNRKFFDTQSGASLLEVMVALIILSIGLLGLAMLQLKGMRFNTNAYFRTQATLSANDIIERMRNNPAAASAYTATPSSGEPSPDCDTSNCNTTQLAAHDLWAWSQALTNPATGIPGATTLITAVSSNPAAGKYTISISWTEEGQAIPPQTWALQL